MADRKQMNVRLTDEARRGWDRAAKRHSTNLTALMEAFGVSLDERSYEVPVEIVERAAQIEYERDNP